MAVALEVIEWPLGLFLAAIPAVKLLNRQDLPRVVRFAVHAFDGMAKPVGGDAHGTIRLVRTPRKLRTVAERAVGEEPRTARPRRARRSPAGGEEA